MFNRIEINFGTAFVQIKNNSVSEILFQAYEREVGTLSWFLDRDIVVNI